MIDFPPVIRHNQASAEREIHHTQTPDWPRPVAPLLSADQAARGIADRVLRGDRHVSRRAGHGALAHPGGRHAGHRAGRRRGGGGELPDRTEDRCLDGAHARPAAAAGRGQFAGDPAVLGPDRRQRTLPPLHLGESLHHVADLCHLRRLCGDLHHFPQAQYLAEHRHRRRIRCHAAGARLGGGDRRRAGRSLAAVPDHFRMDPAAFLVAGPVPHQGVRRGRTADAAGDPRRRIHPAPRVPVHRRPDADHPRTLCHRDGGLVLPDVRRAA